MPIDPDFKTTNRYWLFALYPILLPRTCAAAASSVTAMRIGRKPTTCGSGPPERAGFAA
jgi:hypothetical protein